MAMMFNVSKCKVKIKLQDIILRRTNSWRKLKKKDLGI